MNVITAPKQLNLAIARRCHVSCIGCYTYFGRDEPDLAALVSSVAAFVRLGVDHVTVSGGDPLTIEDLPAFLRSLRSVGVKFIKLDTVGVGLTGKKTGDTTLRDLVAELDLLGIPLDGWSDESVLAFRHGRRRLYTETSALLDAIDELCARPNVVINTVAHRDNLPYLERIFENVRRHRCVCHWNVFQYTPTDQAAENANARFFASDVAFERFRDDFFGRSAPTRSKSESMPIDFRSRHARLGQYLLINSDGEAWLPDEHGNTIRLGSLFGREAAVLSSWAEAVSALSKRVGGESALPADLAALSPQR